MISRRLLLLSAALVLLSGTFVSLPRQIRQWQLDERYVEALNKRDLTEVHALLKRGASGRIRGRAGFSALHLAARQDDVELTRLLLERGNDPNSRDNARHTPLMMAAGKRAYRVLALLVERGADLEARDKSNLTAADHAREAQDEEALRLLQSSSARSR